MSRPSILAPLGYYLPGFKGGGPVRSIANLVDALGHEFDFRIVCGDRDLGDEMPYPGIAAGNWTQVGSAQVRYTAPHEQTLAGLARIIRSTPHDILYLNSFFSPRFTILPLIARRLGLVARRPLVLAPRGEFSPGALSLKSVKKRIYRTLATSTGLLSGIIWQASSEHELADIQTALGVRASDIFVVMNLPATVVAPAPHTPRKPDEPLRIVFLSRISPKKNLDYALRVLAAVRAPVNFSIVGPPEDAAYLAECQRLAEVLPVHVNVRWCGGIDPADVPHAMAGHDLFFLPTRGENFGHVIAEALGAGTPVLISDATPWRGLAEQGIGDDLPLADPVAFVAAIERAAALVPGEAAARRACAFNHAVERLKASDDVEAHRRLFTAALERAGQ